MGKTKSLRQKWHVPPIPGGPFLELCASNARTTHKLRLLGAAYGIGGRRFRALRHQRTRRTLGLEV